MHAIGYEASTLLHEGVFVIRTGVPVKEVARIIHIHPTLRKIVKAAFQGVSS